MTFDDPQPESVSRGPAAPRMAGNRTFGFVLAGLLVLFAGWPLWGGGELRSWVAGLAAVLLGLSVVAPAGLAPLNRSWTRLAHGLQIILTPVLLALIYSLVVLPTGLVMRLLGRDLLGQRDGGEKGSFWRHREQTEGEAKQMKYQF